MHRQHSILAAVDDLLKNRLAAAGAELSASSVATLKYL